MQPKHSWAGGDPGPGPTFLREDFSEYGLDLWHRGPPGEPAESTRTKINTMINKHKQTRYNDHIVYTN